MMSLGRFRYGLIVLSTLAAAGGALAQVAQNAPVSTTQPQPSPLVDKTLTMLQDRGNTLHDFTAKIHYDVKHRRSGDVEANTGTLAYEKDANGGAAKFAIHFDKQVIDEGVNPADRDYVFDGQHLTDRDTLNKRFSRHQLVPPGKAVDPLKLGEGPLPLPIGQDKNKILHDFVVTDVPPAGDQAADPANTIHLRLVPRNSDAYNFNQLDVWADSTNQLPVKIVMKQPDKTTTTVTLTDPQINEGKAPTLIKDVVLPADHANWQVDEQ